MKKCIKCKIEKPLSDYYEHKDMIGGYVNECKQCAVKRIKKCVNTKKEYYHNYKKGLYKKNLKSIFSHRYSSAKARIEGRATRKYNIEGAEICTKKEFIEWCYAPNVFFSFYRLYDNWKINDYPRKLTPSIDRINNNRGYTIDNIRWITQVENSHKYNKNIDFENEYNEERRMHRQDQRKEQLID